MNRYTTVIGALAAALSSTAVTGAAAQTSPGRDDVVVMRRVIAPAQRRPSVQVGEWNVGAWSDASQQCGIARIKRQVTCAKGEGQCTTTAPADEDEVFGTATDCPFQWRVGGYGPLSSTCSPTAVRQRDVECVDRSGAVVASTSCEIAYKPDPVETTESFQSCTYGWATTPWAGSCTREQPRTRTATCTMLEYATPADDQRCGTKPALTQPVSAPDRCDNQWRSGAWTSWDSTCSDAAKRTRTVECIDDEGAVTENARCPAIMKPAATETRRIVDGCGPAGGGGPSDTGDLTYSWKAAEFGELNSSCSPAAARNRSVTCVDSGERDAPDAKCDAATRPPSEETVPVFTGCTAIWASGGWGPWSSTCSVDAHRERTVSCMRTDGNRYTVPQDDEACDPARRPAAGETGAVYTSCTYRWATGGYVTPQACGATTATRAVTCERVGGDGASVDDSLCIAADRPAATMPATDMRGCTYKWSVGEYGEWSSTCSKAASHSRTASCTRIDDGQEVDGTFCAADTPPKLTETNEMTTGCTWDWAATPTTDWTQNGMCAAVRTRNQNVACMRSDGEPADAETRCTKARPGPTESQSLPECGYEWNAVYAAEADSCGPASKAGVVTCLRADGQPAADAKCDPAKRPAASLPYTNHRSCTFGWVSTPLGAWDSTCANNASRSISVSCQRSDGEPAGDAQCSGANKPGNTTTGINTTGCAAMFSNASFDGAGGWSGDSNTDFPNASVSRSGPGKVAKMGNLLTQVSTGLMNSRSTYRIEFWAVTFEGNFVAPSLVPSSGGSYIAVPNIRPSTSWAKYSATFTPKATNINSLTKMTLRFDSNSPRSTYIDDVVFYAIAP